MDEILWRTVLGIAIVDITDPAADADLRKSYFRHIVTHCSGNPAKRRAVIAISPMKGGISGFRGDLLVT